LRTYSPFVQVDFPLVAGLVCTFVIVLVSAGLFKFYLVWRQRHEIFKLLDFTTSPDELPHNELRYTKIGMLRESSQFKRTEDQVKAEENAGFYDLDKDRHQNLWKFVTSNLRSPGLIDEATHISRIQLVRVYQETDFRHKLFEASRAESLLPEKLKFKNYHPDLVSSPLYLEGKAAYDARCNKLVAGLENIKLMFAWHGCKSGDIYTICNSGLKKIVAMTDPGFFGEGCYLSPECEYALRYSRSQPNARQEIGVILFACECPVIPYVVTSADYPIAEPPLRDPGIPYGFSKFFGRQMQLACSAHWISVKEYAGWENPLNRYFDNRDDWEWNGQDTTGNTLRHKPSGKIVDKNLKRIPASLKELQEQKYIPIVDFEFGSNSFQYQPNALPPFNVPKQPLENPDMQAKSVYGRPNVLLPGLLDYQYHPENGCTGHELVVREGMSLPIAIVWFKADVIETAIAAQAAAAATAAAAAAARSLPPVAVDHVQVHTSILPHVPQHAAAPSPLPRSLPQYSASPPDVFLRRVYPSSPVADMAHAVAAAPPPQPLASAPFLYRGAV